MQTTKKNLILLGMMAVGKTTIGRILAKKLKLEFIDTDKKIEKENFMKIGKIFEIKGELFFRKEEEKIVLESLKKENCVIALGGGTFMNKTVREQILKNSISFWLKDDIKTLHKRAKRNQNRPLLNEKNSEKKISELYAERKKFYKLASHEIECDKQSKNFIVKKIIELYEKR